MLFENINWENYYKWQLQLIHVERWPTGKVKKKKYELIKSDLKELDAVELKAELEQKNREKIDNGEIVVLMMRDHHNEKELRRLSASKSQKELDKIRGELQKSEKAQAAKIDDIEKRLAEMEAKDKSAKKKPAKKMEDSE